MQLPEPLLSQCVPSHIMCCGLGMALLLTSFPSIIISVIILPICILFSGYDGFLRLSSGLFLHCLLADFVNAFLTNSSRGKKGTHGAVLDTTLMLVSAVVSWCYMPMFLANLHSNLIELAAPLLLALHSQQVVRLSTLFGKLVRTKIQDMQNNSIEESSPSIVLVKAAVLLFSLVLYACVAWMAFGVLTQQFHSALTPALIGSGATLLVCLGVFSLFAPDAGLLEAGLIATFSMWALTSSAQPVSVHQDSSSLSLISEWLFGRPDSQMASASVPQYVFPLVFGSVALFLSQITLPFEEQQEDDETADSLMHTISSFFPWRAIMLLLFSCMVAFISGRIQPPGIVACFFLQVVLVAALYFVKLERAARVSQSD